MRLVCGLATLNFKLSVILSNHFGLKRVTFPNTSLLPCQCDIQCNTLSVSGYINCILNEDSSCIVDEILLV